jgi:CRISPR-associated Csx2 family protein
MWDVLLEHAGYDFDEETIEMLMLLEEERPDGLPLPLRKDISEAVGEHLGVPVEPHLIPVGRSTDEYWEILQRLARLDMEEGRVSVDITHSLRSHPVFLLLALAYFRALREDLSLGSVYYGAYVLAENYFEGKAPIFDLKPMVELLDWIDAAQSFDRYGDAAPLANLLAQSEADLEDLAKRSKFISRVLQLNALSKVEANTGKLIRYLEKLPDDSPLPLRLIAPRLRRLPEQLQDRPAWETTLITAREHWDSYRAAPAVLATWEAVIERLAAALGKDADLFKNHKALSQLATSWDKWSVGPEAFSTFPERATQLKGYRDAIAHSRQGQQEDIDPNAVYRHFPELLEYFEDVLYHDGLNNLAREVSLSEFDTGR